MTRILAAAFAAVLLTCAPAAAQLDTRTIPQAQPLTGTERMPAVQGSGCAAKTTPCASVAVTPSLISTFLAPTFQPLDTDLSAIAALATTSTGRDLLTSADAPAIRSKAGLGLAATQDYREGTFTPTLLVGGSATGITYSTQVGRYTKVGRLVVVQINIILSSKGSGSGAATIGGLPFTAASGIVGQGSLTLNQVSSVSAPSVTVPGGGTGINLVTYNGSVIGLVQASSLTNASEIYLTLSYSI